VRTTTRQWVGVTVESVGDANDDLPLQVRLTGQRGRTEEAVVQEDSITDGWTLQFEKASVLVASYDPNSRAWLGGDYSHDIYPPVSIHSETAR
jgi:hypothetical protein